MIENPKEIGSSLVGNEGKMNWQIDSLEKSPLRSSTCVKLGLKNEMESPSQRLEQG